MEEMEILYSDLHDIYDILEDNGYGAWCRTIKKAVELLGKQDSEKKRILKIVWDTLHEGLSIDTVSDQDWVYERIRNRIEGTYPET